MIYDCLQQFFPLTLLPDLRSVRCPARSFARIPNFFFRWIPGFITLHPSTQLLPALPVTAIFTSSALSSRRKRSSKLSTSDAFSLYSPTLSINTSGFKLLDPFKLNAESSPLIRSHSTRTSPLEPVAASSAMCAVNLKRFSGIVAIFRRFATRGAGDSC